MASPVGTSPPIFPANTTPNASPNGSPNGSPKPGNMERRKVVPMGEGITDEDLMSHERSLNLKEEEIFERQSYTINFSQDQTRRMIDAFDVLKQDYTKSERNLSFWKRAFVLAAVVAVVAVIALIVIACLFI